MNWRTMCLDTGYNSAESLNHDQNTSILITSTIYFLFVNTFMKTNSNKNFSIFFYARIGHYDIDTPKTTLKSSAQLYTQLCSYSNIYTHVCVLGKTHSSSALCRRPYLSIFGSPIIARTIVPQSVTKAEGRKCATPVSSSQALKDAGLL